MIQFHINIVQFHMAGNTFMYKMTLVQSTVEKKVLLSDSKNNINTADFNYTVYTLHILPSQYVNLGAPSSNSLYSLKSAWKTDLAQVSLIGVHAISTKSMRTQTRPTSHTSPVWRRKATKTTASSGPVQTSDVIESEALTSNCKRLSTVIQRHAWKLYDRLPLATLERAIVFYAENR